MANCLKELRAALGSGEVNKSLVKPAKTLANSAANMTLEQAYLTVAKDNLEKLKAERKEIIEEITADHAKENPKEKAKLPKPDWWKLRTLLEQAELLNIIGAKVQPWEKLSADTQHTLSDLWTDSIDNENNDTSNSKDYVNNAANQPEISDESAEKHTELQSEQLGKRNEDGIEGDQSATVHTTGSEEGTGGVPDKKSRKRTATDKPADGVGPARIGSIRDSKGSSSSFQITDDVALGEGGQVTKFNNNIKAIEEIKKPGLPDQAVLVKYVGWGGIPQAFYKPDGTVTKGWEERAKQLKAFLTEDEYNAARASTQNAHYTSKEIINNIWAAVERMGFTGGSILEPSVGTGNFIGLMPTNLKSTSHVHGVELDKLTSKIAQGLYPNANIKNIGFENYKLKDNSFSLAIGNPPFGKANIFDKDRKHLNFRIHNYFFAKSVDALKPKGVLAMVVSNGFMDTSDSRAREYIGGKAKLLMAIRLPNNAFSKNANTEVTTDIIFLQKLADGETGNLDEWNSFGNINDTPINQYFVDHPENLLGEWGKYGSMYRPDSPALVAREGQDTGKLLKAAISKLPARIIPEELQSTQSEPISIDEHRENAIFVKNDKLYVVNSGTVEEVTTRIDSKGNNVALKHLEIERIKSMVGIAEAAVKLKDAQLRDDYKTEAIADAQLKSLRGELNRVYDAHVKQYGFLNNRSNKSLFEGDVNSPFILSLEKYYDSGIGAAESKRTGEAKKPESAQKSDIFTRRTQSPYRSPETADNAQDALTISLSEKGLVDMAYMERLSGLGQDALIDDLKGLIFDDPVAGWVTKEAYLSGNVKRKLKQTVDAENIAALEKVIPADVDAIDITVKPGAAWLPAQVVKAFMQHITGSASVKATYSTYNGMWSIDAGSPSASKAQQWGTVRSDIAEILKAAINNRQIQVRDKLDDGTTRLNVEATDAANNKVEKIKSEWQDWVWQDEARRDLLGKLYNDTFNVYAKRTFDGSHLNLPGKVSDEVFKLRPHQKSGVWRVLQGGAVLFDHTVGTGKTATAIASVMELKRTGKAKKAAVVVPNHLVQQWGKEFIELYPNANILVPTKEDFSAKRRKLLMARIATGDYDAVIIAHSQLSRIANDPVFEADFIKQQIDVIQQSIDNMRREEGKKSRTVKQAESSRDSMKARLEALNSLAKDDNLDFSELGIDALLVDEAHEFKNLQYTTGLQRVAGLGKPTGSKKAFDLFIKSQGLLEKTGGNNLVFLTGTPISNTLAEMFTMQRYLDYAGLERNGLHVFDAWVNQYADIVTDWELSPAGKYKLNTRLALFNNMPELIAEYNQFADVVTRDDINKMLKAEGKELPVPKMKGGKPENIVVDRSNDQADYIGEAVTDEQGRESYPKGSLIWRSENMPKGKPVKGDDNMLKIMSDARKAALDMRLISPSYADNPDSKVNVAVNNVLDTYHQWTDKKGTQLIFLDLSIPMGAISAEKARIEELVRKAEEGDEAAEAELEKLSPDDLDALNSKFSVYDDMKAKLIAKGIPAHELAFIHDANTDKQKQDLFAKVRSGKVRVLMGSTSKMGAGMNVQSKLVALHHMDAPWRPSDLEQREGRIIRQGNEFYGTPGFEVDIKRYATKGTLDSRMWQTIEAKANFIEQLKSGNATDRTVEDVAGEASNAAEMKAAASGNPLILEEISLRSKVKKLEGLKKEHNGSRYRTESFISKIKNAIAKFKEDTPSYLKDIALSKAAPKKFAITINGKTFDKRKEAGEALLKQTLKVSKEEATDYVNIGNYASFDVEIKRSGNYGDYMYLILTSPNGNKYEIGFYQSEQSDIGLSTKIANKIEDIENYFEAKKRMILSDQEELTQLEKLLKPFPQEDELNEAKAKHQEILEQLRPKEKNEAPQSEDTKASKNAKTTGSTKADIEALLPGRVKAMLTANKLVVVQGIKDLPDYLWDRGNTLAHTVWHGSPHDHDKFDSSKIGTGEGAQAFGYGLYFTDKKEIAEWYKETLAKPSWSKEDVTKYFSNQFDIFKGKYPYLAKEFEYWMGETYSEHYLSNGDIGALLKDVINSPQKNDLTTSGDKPLIDLNKKIIETKFKIDDFNYQYNAGKIYQVELAPSQDEYLDWDKPLSEQSEFVKNALANEGWVSEKTKIGPFKFHSNHSASTGKNIYQYWMVKSSDKEASKHLHSLGIRGIRYKAKAGKSEASNYVIFSDDDVSITNKYSRGPLANAIKSGNDLSGIEALYDGKNDIVYLVADMLHKDNLFPVLNHELFHRLESTDQKLATTLATFNKDFQKRFDDAAQGIGSEIELNAYKRVMAAKTREADRLHEFKAYMVTEFSKKPSSFVGTLKEQLQKLFAAIRLAMLKAGIPLRHLTPADLAVLARQGAKIKATKHEATNKNESVSNAYKFSRSEITNAITEALTPTKGQKSLGWTAGLFQRNHLIDMAVKHLPMLKDYKRLSQEKDSFINQSEQVIHDAYLTMQKSMDHKVMTELGRVQGLATRLKSFDPDTFDGDITDLSTEEQEVYEDFEAMPEAAKKAYRTMRDDYREDLEAKKKALIERINDFPMDTATQRQIIDDITAHFDKAINKGVYFPLSRNGDFVVIGKKFDEDGAELVEERVVEHVKNERIAEKVASEMEAQGYTQTKITLKDTYIASTEAAKSANKIAALAVKAIADLKTAAQSEGGEDILDFSGYSARDIIKDGEFDDLLDEFNQQLINALPDTSYRKHFIHRKGTLGYSTDTLRAYAGTRTSAAKTIAALKFDHKINKALESANQTVNDMGNTQEGRTNTVMLKSVMGELRLREDKLKTTDISQASQTLTSLGFMGALGFNVSSAAINMLQVPSMTLPELSGRYNFISASKAIKDAYGLLFDKNALDKQSGFDLRKHPSMSKPENAQLKRALEALSAIGKIDLTMTHEAVAMGRNPSYSDNAAIRAVGNVSKWAGYPFHVAEALNRQITGIAAFNLAYKKHGDFNKALEETIDVIDRTQFDYSMANRSRHMMGNTARVLTLFKAYAIGMSYYVGRNAHDAIAKLPSERRTEARKTLVVQMAMTFATSGLFGLPIGIEAATMAGGLAGFKYRGANFAIAGAVGANFAMQALLAGLGYDDDDELETDFRNWLTDNFNQTFAEFVTKGPARLLPLADISGRTGLSDLWWHKQNKELEGRDQFNAIANALMGPLGSQVQGLFVAKQMHEDGEYFRMFESAVPAALRNAIAAGRMANEGVKTIKGDPIIQRELSWDEIFAKVIGFNPDVVANASARNAAITRQADKTSMKKAHLVNRYVGANAQDRLELMRGDIKAFNATVPVQERITWASLRKSIKLRKSADKRTKGGVYLSKRQEHLRDIGRFAEPE